MGASSLVNQTAVAAYSAALSPILAGPIIARLPGGGMTRILIGAGGVILGASALDGYAQAIVVGVSAGILAQSVAGMFLGNRTLAAEQ